TDQCSVDLQRNARVARRREVARERRGVTTGCVDPTELGVAAIPRRDPVLRVANLPGADLIAALADDDSLDRKQVGRLARAEEHEARLHVARQRGAHAETGAEGEVAVED